VPAPFGLPPMAITTGRAFETAAIMTVRREELVSAKDAFAAHSASNTLRPWLAIVVQLWDPTPSATRAVPP
jgi:hypothetical protein